MSSKLVIICGPTATGKTKLALQLAKLFHGELVSADSRQVYRGMDIGTGKDKPKGVKVWGYDAVEPHQEFSVKHFINLAHPAIQDIWSRHQLPIIVGGTGLYLENLIQPAPTLITPPNQLLRRHLQSLSISQLQQKLKQTNFPRWETMNHSDRHNPRRLIRAIEVTTLRQAKNSIQPLDAHQLWIGLTADITELDQEINHRIRQRVRKGMTKEVKTLINRYSDWHYPAFSATGYWPWRQYLEGKISREEAMNRWQTSERQYARRQLTWFKTRPRIHWFDITTRNWQNQVKHQLHQWLNDSY